MNRSSSRSSAGQTGRPLRRRGVWVLRRVGLVLVLLSIFAVGFGGTFTCNEVEQNSSDFTGSGSSRP